MLSHITFGSNDLPKAMVFYEALFGPLGLTKMLDHPSGGAVYGKDGKFQFGILGTFDGKPATAGNGTMAALRFDDRETIDYLYEKAMKLGGSCEGVPGPRGDGGVYAAYFRDLDGNKLGIFTTAAL